MSKRRLDFLDLITPTKQRKLKPSALHGTFPQPNQFGFGFVCFTPEGTQYRDIPLMLPFSISGQFLFFCFWKFIRGFVGLWQTVWNYRCPSRRNQSIALP